VTKSKVNVVGLMATSITRVVASRVFRNHRVSKGIFVTVKLLRVAKRPSFLSLQKKRSINNLIGGNCIRKFSPQFPPTETHRNANWPKNKNFRVTEKKAVLRRATT